jgi:pyridoxamine-phosphate oxidase
MTDAKVTDIKAAYQTFSGASMLKHYDLTSDPWKNFKKWMLEAEKNEPFPTNVMSIATVDEKGFPSLRCVLLKEVHDGGFYFYTNFESRKGQELKKNPNIAALFYWPKLERQVRIEGSVTKLSREVAEKYFHSRPRGSQISAAVSPQSRPISGRQSLESSALELEKSLADNPVPLPAYWGGFKITPMVFEFWQGQASRMHDRIVFRRADAKKEVWDIEILAP